MCHDMSPKCHPNPCLTVTKQACLDPSSWWFKPISTEPFLASSKAPAGRTSPLPGKLIGCVLIYWYTVELSRPSCHCNISLHNLTYIYIYNMHEYQYSVKMYSHIFIDRLVNLFIYIYIICMHLHDMHLWIQRGWFVISNHPPETKSDI